jgi:hypothetical protein
MGSRHALYTLNSLLKLSPKINKNQTIQFDNLVLLEQNVMLRHTLFCQTLKKWSLSKIFIGLLKFSQTYQALLHI